jgi:hypothetical protein
MNRKRIRLPHHKPWRRRFVEKIDWLKLILSVASYKDRNLNSKHFAGSLSYHDTQRKILPA